MRFPDHETRPTSPIGDKELRRISKARGSVSKDSGGRKSISSDASGVRGKPPAGENRRKSVGISENNENVPKILIPKIKTSRMASKVM